MRPRIAGSAPARAIESDVREAGRIVVWAEAIPDVMTDSTTRKASGPSTLSATVARIASSSSNLPTSLSPANATIATVTAR